MAVLAGVPLTVTQTGCGGSSSDTTITAEQPPEVQQANNAMEEYMKNQSKGKKGH